MTARLTPAELRERQRADHMLLGALDADPCPIHVTGHRSAVDVRANRAPVPVGDPNPPSHYRVVYDFETLRAPAVRHRPTVIHVLPNPGGGYPASSPSAWVVSDVVPWTPHFAANVPICHGAGVWRANRTQLVDYVIHLGRLLNFDEPPPVRGYHGYNGAAVVYWSTIMRHRPLNPDLRFPVIRPDEVLRPGPGGPASGAPGTPAPRGDRFRRAAKPVAETTPAEPAGTRFAPAGARS